MDLDQFIEKLSSETGVVRIEVMPDELMDEIVQCITVNPEGSLTFRLLGGVEFTETVSKRGWCITA